MCLDLIVEFILSAWKTGNVSGRVVGMILIMFLTGILLSKWVIIDVCPPIWIIVAHLAFISESIGIEYSSNW